MDNPDAGAQKRRMTTDTDIVIVGGGLNGPALALALGDAGFDVTVIDALQAGARGEDAFDGRGYALALASQRLLKAIGVWGAVAENSTPLLEIRISDGKPGTGPGPFVLEFDHAEIDEGPMGYMVEDRHLRHALLDAVELEPNITHMSAARVVAQEVTTTAAALTLEDGKTVTARVIIGADGRQSGTAERAGISRTGWSYDQTALVCAIAHEKPHQGIAHQFFMPSGPLAILPLKGNRSSIVWSEKSDLAQQINGLSDEKYLQILRPRFGDFLGEISLAGARFTYPLNLTLANSVVSDRLVLVGDAAHGMHPIAGQGLNAGLKDIAVLAQVMDEAKRRGEDIASPLVLERYADWRSFDVATLAAATDVFNRLFSNDSSLLRLGRDLGMKAVNAMPNLRRGFMREAAGLTGELPALMR